MKPLDIIIRILSAANWHLSALRARWQTEADHREANQLGRRNLQPQQIAVLRGNIYNRRKKRHGGTGANQFKQSAQNEHSAKTAAIVAAETGVSPATIKRDGKRAEALRPLQCPRCHAEFGAPAAWPPTPCPCCRRETLVPKP